MSVSWEGCFLNSLFLMKTRSICPTIFFIFPDRIAILQPIDDIYPMFSQNDPTAVSKWKHDFSVMQSALFATIKRSRLPEEMINELTWSVTEGKNASMRVSLKTNINPLNPGQFTCRVYRLPRAIRNYVSVSFFLAAQISVITTFHLLTVYIAHHVFLRFCLKIQFFDYITPLHCPSSEYQYLHIH